jgi:integrase
LGLRRSEISAALLLESEDGADLLTTVKGGRSRTFQVPPWLVEDVREVVGLSTQKVYRLVKSAGLLVGMRELSPHWLRHAHASMLAKGGSTIVEIARSLGHSETAVTAGYIHTEDTPPDAILRVLE